MEEFLGKVFILEGVIFALLGILFFFNPLDSILTLNYMVGWLLIVVGIVAIIKKPRKILISIIDFLFGLTLIFIPTSSANILITIYGAWSLIRGIYLLFVSISNRGESFKFNVIYSVITVGLGAIILANPVFDFLSMPYIIAVYFITTAVAEMYIGMNISPRKV